MTDPAFRCAVASEGLAEPIAGTASTVRAFLLVECGGPWGVDAVRDCRLPDPVKDRLTELERRHRVRPLLIRRPGRRATGPMRVFAGYVDRDGPWLESAEIADPEELRDLDMTGLAQGGSPGLRPHREPVFLVCTHGRHDACCAERGRPLAAALATEAPEDTWEVSHIGGDRFAGNVLVLPHGLYYGRLQPEHAADFVARHRAGQLDLEHLRGRSSYPFAVQAAEIHLRARLGLVTLAPPTLVSSSREGDQTRAVFAVDGSRWEVRIRSRSQPARRLTCRASRDGVGALQELVGIDQI